YVSPAELRQIRQRFDDVYRRIAVRTLRSLRSLRLMSSRRSPASSKAPGYTPFMTDAVILSACRTPIGTFGGALKDMSASDLGAVVIREAIARAKVAPEALGYVIMGCVLQAGAGMNVARQ